MFGVIIGGIEFNIIWIIIELNVTVGIIMLNRLVDVSLWFMIRLFIFMERSIINCFVSDFRLLFVIECISIGFYIGMLILLIW